MFYDLIIVARSTSPALIRMTQNCIDSAKADNVILIETGSKCKNYSNVDTKIQYEGEFNYHRALNMGLDISKGDVHILANNDLVFFDWRTIGEDMINSGFGSASPWFNGSRFKQGEYIFEGYNIAEHLLGWCIFITHDTLHKIGKLSEDVDFWYSDNVYAEQLKQAKIRHGLFCNVRVDHIGSQTLTTMPLKLKKHYSVDQLAKFYHAKRKGF